ncbi:MAG: tetracycline resistance MFS efflux pump [Oligoflexia bacterium]|nr:MAG: tetracycline resistance MFS efflux pump [Oligoflexia bacterium]
MANQNKTQLVIIFLTVFIYLVGFGVVIPIIPVLSRDFGATSTQVGLMMSVYSFMQFLFSPFWGKMSDRVGRRPILLLCLLGEGASYLLFASARSLEVLFLARIFAGFFGASISTASAYISDITPQHERSKGMALIGAAFGLGFIIGPALGGWLAMWGQSISSEPHFGTSFAALWVGGICFLNFLFGIKFLTESHKVKGQIRPQDLGRIKQILNYAKRPLLGSLMLIFLLGSLSMSAMEATLILFVGEKFQWGIKEVSFGFAYIGIIATFNQGFLVRKLLPKIGEKTMMLMGFSLMGLGLLGVSISNQIWILAIMMTMFSFGHSFTNPSVLGSISVLAHENEQGAALGTTQGLASLGRIIGPAFGGFVYGAVHMVAPFVAGGLLCLVAVFLILKNFKNLPESAKR